MGVRSVAALVIGLATLAVLGTACGAATPQYPTRAVDLVMGAPAGTGADQMVRLTAKYLSKELGQPINVINKGGSNGFPAVETVMNAAPDGYTLLSDAAMTSAYQMAIKDSPFKVEERVFIAKFVHSPFMLYSSPQKPWKTLADVAKAVKEKPEDFIWGGAGGLSGTDFSQLQFFAAAGVDIPKMKRMVYTGSNEILAAVAGGHIHFGAASVAGAAPFVQSGKVVGLAVAGEDRSKVVPNVPSAKEAGFPTVNVLMWQGLSGVAKTPKNVADRWTQAIKKVVAMSDYQAELEKIAAQVRLVEGDDYRKEVIAEGQDTLKLAPLLGIAVK